MRKRLALALALAAATLSAAACSHSGATVSPRAVPPPRIEPADPPLIRAGKLASYIQARWPRIMVDLANTDGGGTVVQFQDRASYDYSITNPGAYQAHVQKLTGDLAQASVELLKLSLRYFPHLRYASVYQDGELQAFWSKREIEAMASPDSYRDYRSVLRLIMNAQYPPSGPGTPPLAPSG
jgi:hypothetical protein